jgi:hypothetical protein
VIEDERLEASSRHGRLFWASVVVGGALIAVGVWNVEKRQGAIHPLEFTTAIVVPTLVHDLLVAPLALLVGVAVHRVAPRIARGAVVGVLVISATLAAYAFPGAMRFGEDPHNPSLLPRDVGAGLALLLAATVGIGAGVILIRTRGANRR